MTLAWWNEWRTSPAQTFTGTDWSFLVDTALMHHSMWDKGQWTLAAEVRLRAAKNSSAAEDRARLKLKVDEPTAARRGPLSPAGNVTDITSRKARLTGWSPREGAPMPRMKSYAPPATIGPALLGGWPWRGWNTLWFMAPVMFQGDPVRHGDEYTGFVVDCYAVDDNEGRLLYDSAFFSRPKGCDKSGLGARVGLFEALGPARFAGWAEGGEVYRDPWGLGFEYTYEPGEPMGSRDFGRVRPSGSSPRGGPTRERLRHHPFRSDDASLIFRNSGT
ncbi:hypothetical protein SMICM17S_07179 [Streptomyces microflavus]